MALVYTASPDTAAMAFMGQQSTSVANYIQQTVDTYRNAMSHMGNHFIEQFNQRVYDVTQGETARKAAALYNHLRSVFRSDGIYYLGDVGAVQTAPVEMIPYLMEHPTLMRLYQDGSVSGYGDDYVNPQEFVTNHLDRDNYRMATNGMLTDRHNGTMEIRIWNTPEVENPLNSYSKTAILRCWDLIDEAIEEGTDPSSRWNDVIG